VHGLDDPTDLGGAAMKRAEIFACIYLRDFPAQALLRLRPELRRVPCVVMAGEPPLETVCALTYPAHSLGMTPGITKAEVETFPGITVLRRSHGEEATARAALLECAGGFSPRVEDCSEPATFRCVIDVTGTEVLFGPPAALVKLILARVLSLGVEASIAACGNFCASLAIAKGIPGAAKYTPKGKEAEALSLLPLDVLNCPPDLAKTFSLWGIRTLGALAALPERELVSRMGQSGRLLRQHARGEAPHLFQPVEPPLSLAERMELDNPIDLLDPLLFLANAMLEQITLRASALALALASVTIGFALDGGGSHFRTVRPALPMNDRQLWIKLLHLDLEANPPAAPVVAVSVDAEPGATSKIQLGLFSPQTPEASRLDVTLARLRNLVGDGNVGRVVLEDSHRPDGFRVEPFVVPSAKPTTNEVVATGPCAKRWLRPAEPVLVALQAGRPIGFTFQGQRYSVTRAYGPWRTSGDWWESRWESEQWDVIAETRESVALCCCMVRNGQRWLMAALYD
jgi:protein ImuB